MTGFEHRRLQCHSPQSIICNTPMEGVGHKQKEHSGNGKNEGKMNKKTLILTTLLATGLGTAAQAETFKFAFQGSLNFLDPYSLNETLPCRLSAIPTKASPVAVLISLSNPRSRNVGKSSSRTAGAFICARA